MFVLDTDHISMLERADSGEHWRLIHRLDQAGVEMLVTTVVIKNSAETPNENCSNEAPVADPALNL